MGVRFPFGVIRMFWNEIVGMVAQLYEYINAHWIYFKMVSHMAYELYLNKNKSIQAYDLLKTTLTNRGQHVEKKGR